MSEADSTESPTTGTAGNYSIATSNQSTAPRFDGTVTTCYCDPLDSDAARKEAKRKADHAHNLRLQKARRHGGKMKPF